MNRTLNLLMLATVFLGTTSFYTALYSKSNYYMVVNKTNLELKVYDNEGWLITYPIVLGNDNIGDKLYEGDRKTPEGTFTLVSKKVHSKWCRYMGIDYPTGADIQKFNERKQEGIIPPDAKIGGGIGIHGTWPHEEFAIDKYQNWTMGCVSLKNDHIKELYELVPVGTRVTIQE